MCSVKHVMQARAWLAVEVLQVHGTNCIAITCGVWEYACVCWHGTVCLVQGPLSAKQYMKCMGTELFTTSTITIAEGNR
jgi:hypothetical protein